MEDDDFWKALANPIRRKILDLLKDGPQPVNALDDAFEGHSRYAVMQHLEVLEGASLVLRRRQGRQTLNYLNAIPLREVYERWVDRFAGSAAASAVALKKHVEQQPERKEPEVASTARAVRIENEMRVKASIEKVWAASTTEQLAWYPHTYGEDRVKGLVFEGRVGGQVFEDWGNGCGHLYGVITHYDPPKAYSTHGQLGGGISLTQTLSFEEEGDVVVVKGTTVTFGEISDEMEEQIRFHGDLSKYEEAFKAYVES
jgi:DNA-binding transcriptional ArsR family regulator/uncharacterized protein YndB with AHSA1/START domain